MSGKYFTKTSARKDEDQVMGGSLLGAAGGSYLGYSAAAKAIKEINKINKPLGGKVPGWLGKTVMLSGALAGIEPGAILGKHFGEGIEEILGVGRYKDRGTYKKRN
jgi:hypothetical protein